MWGQCGGMSSALGQDAADPSGAATRRVQRLSLAPAQHGSEQQPVAGSHPPGCGRLPPPVLGKALLHTVGPTQQPSNLRFAVCCDAASVCIRLHEWSVLSSRRPVSRLRCALWHEAGRARFADQMTAWIQVLAVHTWCWRRRRPCPRGRQRPHCGACRQHPAAVGPVRRHGRQLQPLRLHRRHLARPVVPLWLRLPEAQ